MLPLNLGKQHGSGGPVCGLEMLFGKHISPMTSSGACCAEYICEWHSCVVCRGMCESVRVT